MKIQWSGDFYFPVSGWYDFTASVDDGVRVWLDGWDWYNDLIINGWQGPGTFSTTEYISVGTHRINVIYRELSGLASVDLTWNLVAQQ